ncbi:MAG: tetratricopeptide repeat protein [Actinomycetota bacterium]
MSRDKGQQESQQGPDLPSTSEATKTPSAPANGNDRTLSWYAAREPVVIFVLSAIAIVCFFLVSTLSGVYKRQLNERGMSWFSRGENDLQAGRIARAVVDFQAALTYSRDNYQYELRLAQALASLNRTEEARAYLLNLWQREPENGSVNLELARIYAGKGDVTQALRYYHNAIYAVWSGDAEPRQLSVRLELVKFLLDRKAFNQAESELIAVGRSIPEDPTLQMQIGDLFMRVPDYQRALALYQQALKSQPHSHGALARAGRAAFELGQYRLADRYLAGAVSAAPNDIESLDLLRMARTIPKMDPYNFLSSAKRDRMVLSDFNTAGARLSACMNTVPKGAAAGPSLQALSGQWTEMKTRLNLRNLRRHPDWTDSAMDLVFNIERQTANACGTPTGDDLMLLLIAKRHEGS